VLCLCGDLSGDEKARRKFIGPLLMQDIARLSIDKRDEANRLSEAVKEGLLECRDCDKRCNQVCPAGLDVYGIAIERLRL